MENEVPLTDDDEEEEDEEGLLLIPPLLRPLVVPQKPWAIWTVLEWSSSAEVEESSSEDSSAGGETGLARANEDFFFFVREDGFVFGIEGIDCEREKFFLFLQTYENC